MTDPALISTDRLMSDLDQLLRCATEFTDREADERWQIVAKLHGRTDRLAFEAACRLAVLTTAPSVSLGWISWARSATQRIVRFWRKRCPS